MAGTRVNSYERQGTIDSEDVDIVGKVQTSSIADTAAGQTGPAIEVDMDRIYSTQQLDNEKFMRDELEVHFHEPQSENDPAFVEVNVNGDYKMAVRGDTVKLRRYHVAVLAQAKQSRVRQRKIVNADGSMAFVEENVLSLSYPFSVTHDPNPKRGAPWLKQMLSNPI